MEIRRMSLLMHEMGPEGSKNPAIVGTDCRPFMLPIESSSMVRIGNTLVGQNDS
jgi:hypothetical protein